MPPVIQIVPALVGGVADHAQGLRQQWSEAGHEGAHNWPLLPLDESGARAKPLHQRLLEGAHARAHEHPLAASHEAAPAQAGLARFLVLLHFSGYGYHPRGLCDWLVDEVRATRLALGAKLRLAIMFHELFAADRRPWRSAFWLGPAQRRLARTLARAADVLVTNTEHHARWLRRAQPAAAPRVWPVFSNVGEPGPGRRPAERLEAAAVFGSASTSARVYEGLRRVDAQGRMLRAAGVRELVDIGPALPGLPPHWGPLSVRAVGRADPIQITALLGDCRFGLIEYPAQHLAKSSVFASYAAHGCPALNLAAPGRACDGLVPEEHYLGISAGGLIGASRRASRDADAIATAAWTWYAAHRLDRQAVDFLDMLRGR